MAINDGLVLSSHSMALERRRETIVLVRWALILTCAYLMLLGRSTAGPSWLGPVLVAAYLASNLTMGRLPRAYFGSQSLKIGVAVLDTFFIAAALWVAQQLSVELLLLCLGVLILAIAGLSLGVIAGVTLALSLASLAVAWFSGTQIIWQTSMLLRVPFLLGAALVFALLVESPSGHRTAAQPEAPDDLLESLGSLVAQQNEAIRRCSVAMAEGAAATARQALEDVVLHNRQMARALARLQPEATRSAA